jgi:multiple sugar transport system permease protein
MSNSRTLAIHVLLAAICVVMALPLFWMVLTALKTHDEVYTHPYWWWPSHPHLADNIKRLFATVPFGRYFLNSFVVSSAATVTDLLFATMAGYALAKFKFPGQRLFFALVVGTMMVPFIVILIPEYVIIRSFGWLDTYQGLIAPFAISSLGIFLMRQAFARMPDDILDAARMDGAGEWYILFRIAVPLNVAPLVSLAILRFLDEWDSLLWPLVATHNTDMRTMSLGLALLQDDRYGVDMPVAMTAAMTAIIPIVLLYLFLQRYVVSSVVEAGAKG